MSLSNITSPAPGDARSVEQKTIGVNNPLPSALIRDVPNVLRQIPIQHLIVILVIAGLVVLAAYMLHNAANLTLLTLTGCLLISARLMQFSVAMKRWKTRDFRVAFELFALSLSLTEAENRPQYTASPGKSARSASRKLHQSSSALIVVSGVIFFRLAKTHGSPSSNHTADVANSGNVG